MSATAETMLADIHAGRPFADALGDAMRTITLDHAAHLRELGPVRVLALDPCPRCTGHVIASNTVAKCTSCDFTVGGGIQ